MNVIPERIIFVSRGITVLSIEIVGSIQNEIKRFSIETYGKSVPANEDFG